MCRRYPASESSRFWVPFVGSSPLSEARKSTIAAFFSSFSSPILSGVFTFGIFAVGRVTPELRAAIDAAESPVIRGACRLALYLVPDLNLFQVSGTTLDGKPVSVHGGV